MTDCACLGLLLIFVASPAALAQEEVVVAEEAEEATQGLVPIPNYGADLWNRTHLSGNWSRGAPRTLLANKSIQLDVNFTQYLQGVVDGGIDRTTRYGGHVDYSSVWT